MTKDEALDKMNELGGKKIPFLFIIDFEMQKPIILAASGIDPECILYHIGSFSNAQLAGSYGHLGMLAPEFPGFNEYKTRFNKVRPHFEAGDTFLVNLTMPIGLTGELDLRAIFYQNRGKYRVWLKDEFVCFSPETFVKIRGREIFTYPMKGTIRDDKPGALKLLLKNKKELAEHTTVVDLLRNDLSLVSSKVRVKKFRMAETIKTRQGGIIQTSSAISGLLPENFHSRLGEIIFKLLPAGSISGAPKPKTLEIIREAETIDRGYYTGVAGFFNGKSLDSCVLIRFIEKRNQSYYYRSGGGITAYSDPESEYQEIKEKVYVPIG